jgi:hypothetical protein
MSIVGLPASTKWRYDLQKPVEETQPLAAKRGARLQGKKESIMRDRFLSSVATVAVTAAAIGAVVAVLGTQTSAQGPTALKTAWGEPDLQGIWTVEYDTPLQRSPRYANQEFFTEEQRAEFDRVRSHIRGRDERAARGSETDVAGAYNDEFGAMKRTGKRTSAIIDPPDGRIPPMTPEAQKIAATDRQLRLALMQATQTCKQGLPGCAGGKFDPTPTSRRSEQPALYNATRMNRHDGPEDGALADRCLTIGLPEFGAGNGGGSFRRIVQTPGGISMYYDVGQGQGWQRNIVMDGRPHLPPHIRQWFGDSRGRWEGNTLVIDVTNFSPKANYRGSRDNMHLVERWTRTGATALEYVATVEDPSVWTRPWTVTQEFTRQNEQENRIYYEPRCLEGNFGHPAVLRASRLEDQAFAEGRGPDPLTKDNASGGAAFDPLQQ